MLQLIRQNELVEGPWRNGMGVSWEIASHREPDAKEFSWRFAKARIDRDVPFSIYPGMDRVFMQISGNGLDLEFEGGQVLQVHESNVPHAFACDIPLNCKLLDGPCFDLNLFTARGTYEAQASVLKLSGMETLDLTGLPPTPEDVAAFLKVSVSWVRHRVAANKLPHHRVGGWIVRFDPVEIRAWATTRKKR